MGRSRNTLNNLMMDNCRRDNIYRAIITDLVITGNLPREDGEMLLGYEIPNYLHTPDGTTIDSNNNDDNVLESGLNDIRS